MSGGNQGTRDFRWQAALEGDRATTDFVHGVSGRYFDLEATPSKLLHSAWNISMRPLGCSTTSMAGMTCAVAEDAFGLAEGDVSSDRGEKSPEESKNGGELYHNKGSGIRADQQHGL